MNIKGEGRNGTCKKKERRRKGEVMMHGHGLREREMARGGAHTSTIATQNINKGQCRR